MGLDTEGPQKPPLIHDRPLTPGEVTHPFDDGHVEVQRVPPDFIRDDIVTRRLLRDELQYFAKDALREEISKMRVQLQEDIQDVMLQMEAGRSAPTGKNAAHLSVPKQGQWAAPRPPPDVSETIREMGNGNTLRSIGDTARARSQSGPYTSETSSTRFLLKGNDFFDNYIEVNPIDEEAIRPSYNAKANAQNVKSSNSSNRGSKEEKHLSQQEIQKDMKRLQRDARRRSFRRRPAKMMQTTTKLPAALPESTKQRMAKCCEVFLEQGIAVIIVLNGIFIGVQADYQARNVTEAVPTIFPMVEILFGLIFVTELTVRIVMFGKEFFTGPGWRWNWFDAVLVLIQIIEVGGMLFTNHESSSATPVANVSFLRLLRILRLFRVLRLVRLVQFIGELNTIISSIANSMRSLCWTLFLLLMMVYIVAILFTQAVFSERVLMKEPDPAIEELSKWWGTLDRSVLSLYQAILGGVDWEDVTLPLSEHVSPLLTLLFCLYIAFALLAMMNVITGIFVESALKNAEKEKDAEFTETAQELFVLSDTDASGQITWDEFEMQIDEPRFHWYVKSFGIDPADAKLLFKLLDHDKSGSLDLEELLSGMIKLRAGAKFMDIMKLMHEIERTNRRLGLIWENDKIKKLNTL